ncbi:hypothetical protein BJ878DRAFT_425300 [Calycina marina]|uniref:NAD(P)-binding domain-containing protein n=1 Tax=Calycina marina TaxID=1763456 RepID=A0A9P7Z0L9_9HELO|nr:hypothetical protein BJ878DRAFT_425300 [Calycina marina]
MTSTAVIGSTGLVGSHILSTLLGLPSVSTVHALARRQPIATDTKLHPLVSADTSNWASNLSSVTPPPSILLSALGTTRAQAGGLAQQRLIDYDLNLDVAKAAKAAGVKVYVLISSGSANSKSMMPYLKMKGELEDSVNALGFDHTIILRPGLIVGGREDWRPTEFVIRKVAGVMGMMGSVLKDFWAQDAEVIANAAVSAGLKALEGGDVPKVWEVGQSEIIKLGRTEWKA